MPQLVGPSEVEARETLPSFHYQPAAGEFPAEAVKLPWTADEPRYVVGFFARSWGGRAGAIDRVGEVVAIAYRG